MNEVVIAMPTSRRAGRVLTTRWLPNVVHYVHVSELGEYREHYPDAVFETHDVGHIANIRQFIYERHGDVFLIDDDCQHMISLTTPPFWKLDHAKGERAYRLIQRLYAEACDLDVKLFGFANFGNPATIDALHPYRLHGIVFGQAMGLRASNGNLFFSTDVTGFGDYWIGLLNAYHYRMALMDQRWFISPKQTFTLPGGGSKFRTMDMFAKGRQRLIEAFGEEIIHSKRKVGTAGVTARGNKRAAAEQRHDEQFTVRLPFPLHLN